MRYPFSFLRSTIGLLLCLLAVPAVAETPFLNRQTLVAPSPAPAAAKPAPADPVAPADPASPAPAPEMPAPVAADTLDRVVAVVNDRIITSLELDQRVHAVEARLQQQDPDHVPPADTLRRQVLQQMILQDIELQMAERDGIKVDKATLDQAIANIARSNNLSTDQLREALVNQGQSWAAFEKDLKDRILVDRLTQREVEARVRVSPEEVQTFAHQIKEIGGLSFELQQIFIAVPENATPEQIGRLRQKADDVRGQLLAGYSFTQMAIAVSNGREALQGGNLGWVKAGELPPSIAQILAQAQPGSIGPVIQTPTGFHIFKVLDVKKGQATITEVHARAIFLRASNPLQLQEAESRTQDIMQSLQSGSRFSELARSYSQDPTTAAKGGDLGWVAPGQLPDVLEHSLMSLAPDSVSSPIRTPEGIYLLQSLGQRQVPVQDSQLVAAARMQLYNRKVQERLDQWQRQIRDSAFVRILTPELSPEA